MQKEELKKEILERINQIDDSNMLNVIQTLLNTLENKELGAVAAVHNALETEDFSGYIKEWLKDM